jgi:hypothetical protein
MSFPLRFRSLPLGAEFGHDHGQVAVEFFESIQALVDFNNFCDQKAPPWRARVEQQLYQSCGSRRSSLLEPRDGLAERGPAGLPVGRLRQAPAGSGQSPPAGVAKIRSGVRAKVRRGP